GKRPDSACPGAEALRHFRHRQPKRRDHANPADDDRNSHQRAPLFAKTTAALLPANADDVDKAVRTVWRRGSPITRSSVQVGSRCSQLSVAGTSPVRRTWVHMIASKLPAAASVWPIAPLMEFTGTRPTAAPKTAVIAAISMASLYTVPVPCALTKSMAEGSRAASASAMRMARAAPAPSRAGAVM